MSTPMPGVPAHVETNPALGTWLEVVDGVVRVRVGKVELGQGIVTTLSQLAADALDLPLTAIAMVPATTAGGPDQDLTAGSMSVQQTGPALRHIGSVVRRLAGPTRPVPDYIERIAALDPAIDLAGAATSHEPFPVSAVGRDAPRLDLPDKVLGRPRYIADLRPDGLLHGRVLRPPSPGATLDHLDPDWKAPGVQLVRDGSFLGVVGEREAEVDAALEQLRSDAAWSSSADLPDEDDLSAWLRSGEHEEIEVAADLDVDHPHAGDTTHTASYSKPFLIHASIAPSAAVAQRTAAGLHVWSHSQGIFALRRSLAASLGLPADEVTVEHVENAGCYGHNAADDAALDAALLASATPGRPVQVRWSRPDELTWAPLSSAMTATVSASVAAGRIRAWSYDVWSQGHSSRPGFRGHPGLLAGAHRLHADPLPAASDPPLATGGGTTRNAVPIYRVGSRRITGHRKVDTILRTSAMRSLGAFLNVFAIECFMDELAERSGVDPLQFRLDHLDDPRARHVLETAARLGRWGDPTADERGRGLGFARYKEKGAWCAVVAEVEVEVDIRVTDLTVVADIGAVVSPDGARNQLEGGAVQATSWTVRERVRFDRTRITSDDWEQYPILRFTEVPAVRVHLVDSDAPSLGAGEAAQGPTAAAIANAVHRALGVRVRDLPINADAIVSAIEAQTDQ